MFDLYIEFNADKQPVEKRDMLNNALLKQSHCYCYQADSIFAHGHSHEEADANWHEDNDGLFICMGDIFYRRTRAGSLRKPLVKTLVEEIRRDEIDLKIYQGNFWIIYYDKNSDNIQIFSDLLTVLPLYLFSHDNKFIITSNLMNFAAQKLKINHRVALGIMLFNQPLSDDTIVQDVKYLKPGKHVGISQKGINEKEIVSLAELMFNDQNTELDIHELILDFNHSVLSLANANSKNLVTLTGGYDSRSIISTLLKENLDVKSFSFGREGGPNTQVPLNVSTKLKLDYEAFYLGKDYVDNYAKYADEVIFWSDGLSAFERANYLYVADKIRKDSKSYISGLVGGEIFAPMTMYTTFCTRKYADIFYEGSMFNLKEIIKSNKLDDYLNLSDTSVMQEMNDVMQDYQNELNLLKNHKDEHLIVFYDFVKNGFRTFYGGQIHTERAYVHNKIPFYSMDILERVVASNQKHIFKNSFKGDAFSKRNNRILQAKIIDYNFPALGKINTDRGFSPSELLSPIGKLTSAVKYVYNNKKQAKEEPEFISNVWSENYYGYLLALDEEFNSSIFNNNMIKQRLSDYKPDQYSKQFNRLLSVARWIQMYETRI